MAELYEGRRYASHRLLLPTGQSLKLQVVHTDGRGRVLDWYPLQGEPPMVEWLPGTIALSDEDGVMRARHYPTSAPSIGTLRNSPYLS